MTRSKDLRRGRQSQPRVAPLDPSDWDDATREALSIEERDALKLAYDAVSAGASGVDMGRNIFQSKWPVQMIQAVRGIVHEGKTADESWDWFQRAIG